MVVMKRRSVRVVLALLVLILAGTFFLAAQPETPSASPLENLLSGYSTDIPGALSSLNDADLPLALAVAEALKFKALHGDTKISAEKVEEFQQAVTGRIDQSQAVSLAKSKACPIAVPARKATLAGLELTVPACFRAEQPLAVLDSGPRNEAGTLFPECWISFVADKKPVQIRMTVDGKVVPTSLENDRLAVFRPPLSPDGVFSLGTHTVSVILTDAGKNQASASWSFSIGASPSPADPPPGDATIVASITLEVARIAPGSRFPGFVTINILTDKAGKRYFEYLVFPKGVQNRGCYRTSSLWMLQKTLGGGSTDGGFYLFIATPKTEYAFEGNKLFFATDFRPNPDAVWSIDKIVWKIGHGESQETIEGPEISLTMGKSVLDVDVSVFFTFSLPEFPDQVSHWDLFAWTSIYPIQVNPSVGVSRQFELVDNFKETAISIEASRRIIGYFDLDLKEGSENPISEGAGTILVKKSHWKTVASSGTVTIEDPLATATKAIFKTPGVIELVNEIELTLDWQGEKYNYTYVPEESALVGVFPASGSVEYEKFPKGIIFDTSRLIRLKSLQVEIDKVKRKFAKSEELFLDPPWVLAKSTLFPDSLPLGIVALHPAHFFDQFDTVIMPDEEDGFLTKLAYDDPALETEGNLITRAYLGWDELGRKGHAKKKRTKAVEGLLPLSKAQKIKAFPNPADLLDVEIVPAAPPPIGQNQKVDFSGSIVAKPQMGNGRITATGGEINLLDGYVSQAVDALEWSATLKKETSKGKGIDFAFQFEPKEGTGTYEIRAGTAVRFEEEDTETEAGATGSSAVNLTVTEGFQIKSPVAGFAYPLKHPVPVRTNIDPPPDSDQNLDLWRKIVWALNKEQWIPPSDRPPINFTPDKTGEWALVGEIKENGLRDEVKFQVKPITVRISPTRKVVPLSTKTVPLALGVKLGETEVTSWAQEVDWVPGLMKAKVEAIEWKAFTSPTTEKPLTVSNPPLKAEVTIDKEGPLTILATVTVRIWSTNPQKPYDETFVISAARADLWAVAPPFWNPLLSTLPDEQFPKKAVAPAGRTFTIKEGSVSFEGQDVSWNPQSGLSSPIEIQPAIPSSEISPATSDKVRLAWSCPGNDPSDSFTYVPTFEKPVETVVKLQSFLVFDEGTDIEFTEKKFTVDVEDINNLVEYYVDPKTAEMNFGETKLFVFVLKPKVPLPTSAPSTTSRIEIPLLNGVYKLILDDVAWHSEIGSISSPISGGLDYTFSPSRFGNYKIIGDAACQLEEIVPSHDRPRGWVWKIKGESTVWVRFPSISFEFQYNDWPKIYGNSDTPEDSVTVLLRITPKLSLEDLVSIGFPLRIHSSSSMPDGYLDIALEKADYKYNTGSNDVMFVYKAKTLRELGVLPSNEDDEVNEYCSCDNALETPDTSNHSDSEEFDAKMKTSGFFERGKARDNGDYSALLSKANVDFVKHAGVQNIWFSAWDSASEYRQIRDQVDWFYWSGHGHHKDGKLVSLEKETAPTDVLWDGDLDVAIISGCSVLDIKDFRAKSFGPVAYAEWFAAGGDWSPGALWEKTGPKYLVGNNWAGPSDVAGTKKIIGDFLSAVDDGKSIPEAWQMANPVTKGPNACVIDCSKIPHEYWYWDETSGSPVWSKVEKGVDGW